MNTLKNIISFLIRLVVIVLAGYFIFKGIDLFFGKIDKINPNIAVAIIAGSVTITGYFITRYLERKKIIEQQIREQKLPVYEEFVSFLFSFLQKSKNKKQINDQKLQDFFWTMNKKSILWLSDRTLKSYIKWKNDTGKYSKLEGNDLEKSLSILLTLENLLKDFRMDIGHKNKNIQEGDILSLFINDWEKIKEVK